MRGRTNIPPRVGGVVNGLVKEYTVAEDNGIDIGDYVELVSGVGDITSGFSTSNLTGYGFSSKTFKTSTNEVFIVTTEAKNLCIHSIKEVESTISVLLDKQTIPLTGLNSDDVDVTFDIVQTSADAFILVVSDKTDSLIFYELTFLNTSFQIRTLQTVSRSTLGYDIEILSVLEITSDTFFINTKNFNLAFTVNSENVQIGSIDRTILGTAIEVVNGYVIMYLSSSVYSISCDSLLQLSITNTLALTGIGILKRANVCKSDSNLFLFPDNISRGYILNVSTSGLFSISSGYSVPYTGAVTERCMVTKDGTICVVTQDESNGLSDPLKIIFVKYDSISGGFTVGPSGEQQLFQYTPNIGSLGYILVSDFVEGSSVMGFILSVYYYISGSNKTKKYTINGFCFKVEQMSLVPLGESLIKKYSTKIDGIAKTGGTKGDIIEVYTPQ